MEARTTRILVVANRTAATPWLLQEVEARARSGPCGLVLLVPPAAGDWTPAVAREQLERAAGQPVELLPAGEGPMAAIERAHVARAFDEVLVSVCPPRGPRWPRRDLARRIDDLGVPVVAVQPGRRPPVDQTVLKVRW